MENALARYDDDPAFTKGFIRKWNEFDRQELAQLGIQALGRNHSGPAAASLARVLVGDRSYLRFLLQQSVVTHEEAVTASGPLRDADPDFFTGLLNEADALDTAEAIIRTLQIVNDLGRANVSVFWLRKMSNHSNAYIRSRAIIALCRLYKNPQLVSGQLSSTDSQIRAGAVEALWGINTDASREILVNAAADAHHRVAANALRGLYEMSAAEAAERMIEMAGHESPMFRAAAAWCMGDTGNPIFRERLEALSQDSAENVRGAAATALNRLQSHGAEEVSAVAARAATDT
ncbi:MAG TPA: HEAT repeat domain-containing protein [Bryobacteraceae bacterium]|nr:HEAT repeat domain-containing protein [Bryobacteraceae bacterium]